jgi:amidase
VTGRAASSWILRLDEGRSGPLVAVKDLIDVAGAPTTAGCRAVADTAGPAGVDAACLAGVRAAVGSGRARIAGKAALHELGLGVTGVNPWWGTPVNPLGRDLVPGGSSSGPASAVATGAADIGIGTDTGGSIRIPAACCGVVGLKTTGGRVPLEGVWPLAPSLDTVGPLGRDVAAVVEGMALLDPAFDRDAAGRPWTGGRLGRLRPPLPTDPAVDAALDEALADLAAAVGGAVVVDVSAGDWSGALAAGLDVLGAEAAELHLGLVRAHPGGVGADVADALAHAARIGNQRRRDAAARAARWRRALRAALSTLDVLVVPTTGVLPPTADRAGALGVGFTLPVNVAGLPALALPVPAGDGPPASLQLVGPGGGEELLCRVGAALEAAVASR